MATKLDLRSSGSLIDMVQAVEGRPGEHLLIGLATPWHPSLMSGRSVGPIPPKCQPAGSPLARSTWARAFCSRPLRTSSSWTSMPASSSRSLSVFAITA